MPYDNADKPANLCRLLSLLKFPGFRYDLGEAIGEAIEEAPVGSLGKRATEHFQDMLSDVQRIEQTDNVGLANRSGEPWCGHKVTGLGASQIEFPLKVQECDIEIAHCHRGIHVPEQLHHGR